MKKFLAFILVCTMVLGSSIQVYATEIETQDMVAIVKDEERSQKIDQLLSERCKLEHEYEKTLF